MEPLVKCTYVFWDSYWRLIDKSIQLIIVKVELEETSNTIKGIWLPRENWHVLILFDYAIAIITSLSICLPPRLVQVAPTPSSNYL